MRAKFINESIFNPKEVKKELEGLPNFLKNLQRAGFHTYQLSDYDIGQFSCNAQIPEEHAHFGSRIYHIYYNYDAKKIQKDNPTSKHVWEDGIKVGIYRYGSADEPVLYKGPLEDWDGAFFAIINKAYGNDIGKIDNRIEDVKNDIINLDLRLKDTILLEKELKFVKSLIQNES